MEIEAVIRLVNNTYHVEIGLSQGGNAVPLTPRELERLVEYGDVTVSIGGTFTSEGLTFTMDNADMKFPSQFPIKRVFSRVDYPTDANARAALFRDTVQTRIQTAMTALLALNPGILGRTVTPYNF